MTQSKKKIRYAVVGLGHIAQVAVLPAFKHAQRNSQLTALVTGDPNKGKILSKKYGVDNVLSYEDYDDLLESGTIDVVYIALPNHLHTSASVRALNAGIHVLCEKPLATSVEDAETIVSVAERNHCKLMTAYRLHFEPSNLDAIELCNSGKIGDIKFFHSTYAFQVTDQKNIRLKHETGGGPLFDIGIYCINAARNLFRQEPLECFAYENPGTSSRFDEVEEGISALLLFPDNKLASFHCSFGASSISSLEIVGTKGNIRLEQAYAYAESRKMYITIEEKTSTKSYKKCDQFAPELEYFSDCILKNTTPVPSGVEGLADLRVIQALRESSQIGLPVTLKSVGDDEKIKHKRRPTGELKTVRPPVVEPKEIAAQGPR